MNWSALLDRFKAARVLVVGDICLDRWCRYDPALADPSRETGIPRAGIIHSEMTPGAGGTVANNLATLGAGRVAVIGAIGRDGFGFELERALSARNIDYTLLVGSDEMQTFTYTKLINSETGVEDQPRIDFVNTTRLPSDIEDQLIVNLTSAYGDYDVIMIADQAETDQGGVVTPAIREVIGDIADHDPDKVIVVDSRNRVSEFRNVIVKPNEAEAEQTCLKLFGEVDYSRLRQLVGECPLVVTRGEKGSNLIDDYGERFIPALMIGEAVDTCGAGDSFGAGLALALFAGAEIDAAVRFGTMVSSVTVMKPGTGTAAPDEVLAVAYSVAAPE
jgi:rfaE bifunctional protein kinase chain/domain